ncbi:sodium-dependent transporter [Eubacterium pyruvativorans]|uniref:sodium-dependent transporter n=1 Tax=Eubacterium pyruvativorans TaxID=155865 RepID=UPI00156307F6|nr:sodium-dependent transporter [Eubacterium pyruvativorans]MCI5746807.1 sodium-dependent transporter [Eubacterium pyruvativorans]MDD6707008.1 sodium-dependent transporter [Eubacterium pyruvativorans]MDD7684772.1 sodium-dependent transporter [Eubacterium pyruvativorans]MDY4049946.1 sodium-dependent transporter [Eubacterium pyruvativorans]
MNNSEKRGGFASSFGFLMAAVGSAVGLGNIWGFPYKAGANGGFAFIIIYIILAVFLGYPMMIGEIALGRKTRTSAVQAFHKADRRLTIGGIFDTLSPFCLICFYVVLGGFVMKYMVANFGDMIHAGFGVGDTKSDDFFGALISTPTSSLPWMLLFLGLTGLVIAKGVESGIEKFSKVAMPALYLLLIIMAIRCCTLPGAKGGLEFMFKPNFEVFKGTGWFKVFAAAGSQLFFSLSLASGCLISFGSYLDKDANIEKQAILVPVLDTIAALLAGCCVLPAVFAMGIEPSGGPGLLFVSLQTVFDGMGSFGPLFGFIFYLLVFLAALSSSIGMMEGAVSALIDHRLQQGKSGSRARMTGIAVLLALLGGILVTVDQLGGNTAMWKPFGQPSWLDAFDLLGEGIFMPLGGLTMTILLGWTRRHYLDDEIEHGSPYRTKGFVNFSMRYIAPILMAFIVFIQISTFFFSKTAWFQALMG